jgi:hypothetical protein
MIRSSVVFPEPAEQGQERAVGHVQGYAVERLERAERLRDVANVDAHG